jgi:hypothetical protein
VKYHLKVSPEKVTESQEAFSSYLHRCPASQSVIGCIPILDELKIEEEERT